MRPARHLPRRLWSEGPWFVAAAIFVLILALAAAGCVGPVMDAQREVLARVVDLEESVQAAQGRAEQIQREYLAGEISAAERDAKLEQIRAEALDGLAAVKDALAATGHAIEGLTPEEVIKAATPWLPPPWDSIATALAALTGAYGISRRGDRKVQETREAARALRGEPVGLPPTMTTAELLAGVTHARTGQPGSGTMAVKRQG